MLGIRLVAGIAAVLTSLGLLSQSVLANGGAFLEFDRRYYVPGEIVTAQTTFSSDIETSGRIEDGPYYAYLLPSDRWIHPPSVPADAIPVGPITITDPLDPVPTARITFTVPQIDTGPYNVALCNQPCTHATLGDLAGGWLSIVPTKDEALRRELSDRFDARLSQVRGNLTARIRRAEKAQRELAPRGEVGELTQRVTRLEERLTRIQKERPREAGGSDADDHSIRERDPARL